MTAVEQRAQLVVVGAVEEADPTQVVELHHITASCLWPDQGWGARPSGRRLARGAAGARDLGITIAAWGRDRAGPRCPGLRGRGGRDTRRGMVPGIGAPDDGLAHFPQDQQGEGRHQRPAELGQGDRTVSRSRLKTSIWVTRTASANSPSSAQFICLLSNVAVVEHGPGLAAALERGRRSGTARRP